MNWPRPHRRPTRRLLRLAGGLLVAAAVFGVLDGSTTPEAGAHTFLVRTVPEQGERLGEAPRELSLEFSEPFDPQGAQLELTVDGDAESLVVEGGAEGRVLQADIATRQDGVYVVSWEVVAFDGHVTTGELAFGVGDTGELPAARTRAPAPSTLRIIAGWVFFAGLALGAGSLASHWAKSSQLRRPALVGGLAAAQVGALVTWVDVLAADGPTRQQLLLGAAVAALAAGLLLVRLRPTWPVGMAVATTGIAWSARSHGAVTGGLGGGTLDAVHLLAGATWLGALVVLAVDLRERAVGLTAVAVVRRYARLAATLVGVLSIAGVAAAARLLSELSDIWTTGYGQALAAKTVLFAGALLLAIAGRWGLVRQRLRLLRRTAPVEAGLLSAVVAMSAVLINLTPPAATQAEDVSLLGPPPLSGPVVRDAGMTGNLTVAVAATDEQLRVEAFAPGDGVDDLAIDVEATFPDGERATLLPRPCGSGCYTQRIRLPEGTTLLTITTSSNEWPGGVYEAQVPMPPPADDPALLVDLVDRMEAEPTVEFTETSTSGPGSDAVPGTFTLTGSEYIDLAPWAAASADDVQPLEDERGFRLYLSGDRIWITIRLDEQGRIAAEHVITGRHEIQRDDFRYAEP